MTSSETVLFDETEYAGTLNWSKTPCVEEEGARKLVAGMVASLAVVAISF